MPEPLRNILAVLSKMLRVAREWGFLETVPAIKLPRAPMPEFDFLTFEEADRLLAAADPQWRTMILTALRSGMRMGELRALRWEDVDLVAGRIMLRQAAWQGEVGTPKSGKPREIPMTVGLVAALKTRRYLKSELVFCNQRGGMLGHGELGKPLARACRRAGLRRVGWHVLRHTFASHLVMRGVPLKAVQELLGHATIQMTMRYSHLAPEIGRQAVAVLEQPQGGDAMAPAWHQRGAVAGN
jgi:integrase